MRRGPRFHRDSRSGPRDRVRINHLIREKEVRIINENEDHMGVMPLRDALVMAEEAGLDLVEVATKVRPHVCRVMDYGQYKYQQAKRAKEARKKQKQVTIKEIKLRPRTDSHDYNFKLRHALEFLESGCKVKVIMIFRGREAAHKGIGRDKIAKMATGLEEVATKDFEPKMEGRAMVTVFSPRPHILRAVDKARAEGKGAKKEDKQVGGEEVPADQEREDKTGQTGEGPHPDQEVKEA